jgi:tRNA pseudouridine-54 N-methylase
LVFVSAAASLIIKPEDTAILVDHCDMTKDEAEKFLRKHNADIRIAIKAYMNGDTY